MLYQITDQTGIRGNRMEKERREPGFLDRFRKWKITGKGREALAEIPQPLKSGGFLSVP